MYAYLDLVGSGHRLALMAVDHQAAAISSRYCELHNNRPKTAETSAIRVS
jgi:hypothetical protein